MTPEKALNVIAGMCSKKEYCCQDIREKLQKWEMPENEIKKILEFLFQHQFIDDSRFALAYAEDKFRFNHWGKQKITQMLRQKHISQEIISKALQNLGQPDYEQACLALLRQKQSSLQEENPYKMKARLIRFGLGRGFDYDLLSRCLAQLPGNPEEQEEFE